MEEKKHIELRSEEVQEVMNHIPSAIVRYGIMVLAAILLLLFLGSYWFKYPDVISAEITLSTQTPPVYVLARTSGKVDRINVKDRQIVAAGTILGVVDNPAVTDDILKVGAYLDKWEDMKFDGDSASILFFSNQLQLGEVQSAYATFISALKVYLRFYEQQYYKRRIQSETQLLRMQEKYGAHLSFQHHLVKEASVLNHNMYRRDSILFRRNAATVVEFEEAENQYLQKKQSLVTSAMALIQNGMQKKQAAKNLMELERQAIEEEDNVNMALKNAREQLHSQLASWQQRYLLQSPIDGKVTLMSAWSENQNVEAGETVFVVAPLKESNPVGKALLPIRGSGKVQAGQRVNIRLNNFPDQEFGYVSGVVSGVSPVPTAEDLYVVSISLPGGLHTNYGKTLPLTRDMKGVADIITDDISLMERFIQPVKKIMKENF